MTNFIVVHYEESRNPICINIDKIENFKDYEISTNRNYYPIIETKEEIERKIFMANKQEKQDLLCILKDIREVLKTLR